MIDNIYNTQILPNGRDFSQLILLVPGANARPGGTDLYSGATIGSNGSGFAIGGREAHNNFMMDGASNNTRQYGGIAIKPSIDAIQEFKVQSNMYSAEFGQAAFGQINLILQQQLPGGLSAEIGYVGNKGTKLTELPYYNIPLPLKPGDTRAPQDRRPFPKGGTALGMSSYVTSSYNSAQVKVQKRFSHGFQFLTSYTWTRSIDLSSERGSGDRGGIDGGDQRRLREYYRGLSGFDIRHRLSASYVFDLPAGRGRAFLNNLPLVADKILGGWQLSGITQFQRGFPFTVLMSGDQNGDGLGGDRPDGIAPR